MLKKFLSLALVAVVIDLACATTVSARAQTEKETRFAEKVKAGMAKLGTGPQARVDVRLRDTTRIRGYVSEARDNEFVVADEKKGTSERVLYSQVRLIMGNNVSTGAKFSLGKKTSSPLVPIGIIVGVVVIAVIGASASK